MVTLYNIYLFKTEYLLNWCYFNNVSSSLSSVPPSISGPAEENVVETISNPVTFACDATGIPPPTLTWLKNGRPIGMPNEYRFDRWSVLFFYFKLYAY